MLAIDTNVIVRYLVGDDAAQARVARRLVDSSAIGVSCTVLLEAEWVLRSLYGFAARQVHAALTAFVALPNVELEHPARVAAALDGVARGMDFADALHLAACRDGEIFVTFDRRLAAAARKAALGKVRLL